ncbi:MAG: hypothetical protein ACP5G2_08270 [Candidatus Bipolaricaulaceae bacterium]
MKAGIGFLLWEGVKAGLRRWSAFLAWAAAVASVLLAGTALVLLPADQPEARPYTQVFLVGALSTRLSEQDVNQLGWEVWSWEEVDQVSFRFSGEEEPVSTEGRALVVRLAEPGARSQVQQRFGALEGIEDVRLVQRTVTPPPRLPSVARIFALAGLVIALGGSLWLGRWALMKLGLGWAEAIAVLRTAGVREWTLRIPYLGLGALAGLLGAGIYLACYWGCWAWAQGEPAVRQVMPAFLTGGTLATALGLVMGIALGALAGLLGSPSGSAHS